jgi:hypothetical protein
LSICAGARPVTPVSRPDRPFAVTKETEENTEKRR